MKRSSSNPLVPLFSLEIVGGVEKTRLGQLPTNAVYVFSYVCNHSPTCLYDLSCPITVGGAISSLFLRLVGRSGCERLNRSEHEEERTVLCYALRVFRPFVKDKDTDGRRTEEETTRLPLFSLSSLFQMLGRKITNGNNKHPKVARVKQKWGSTGSHDTHTHTYTQQRTMTHSTRRLILQTTSLLLVWSDELFLRSLFWFLLFFFFFFP